MKWKDATIYSRGAARVPTAWALQPCADLRLVVTCGHVYHPGEWIMHCAPWFNTRPLGSDVKSAEDAQKEALRLVREKVAAMAAALGI